MTAFCVTPPGILAFPNFFSPRAAQQGGELRYSGILLFDEKTQASKEFKALQNSILTAAQEKFGAKLPPLRKPIRKADEKPDYEGFDAGKVFINAWSQKKPGLIDAQKNEILAREDVWAGQLARFYVRPFGYETSGNKGVSFLLEHVQILKQDMPRIDGRKAATEVFDEYEDEEVI